MRTLWTLLSTVSGTFSLRRTYVEWRKWWATFSQDFLRKIWNGLIRIHQGKILPDGMNALFYQRYSHIVGSDVYAFVFDFFRYGIMPQEVNCTNIVRIPKNKALRSAKDYWPISLRNVVYKLVAKVLANHLKKILPNIISPNQDAFVPERQIFNNSMVAYETVAVMKNRRQGRKGAFALKLDMSKAYDRVEWDYLEMMMKKLPFSKKWIGWFMERVRTVSYSVIVNGQAKGRIVPSWGLRQGDPISPISFSFVLKGSRQCLKERSWIEPLKKWRHAKMAQRSLISSSPIIAYSFVKLRGNFSWKLMRSSILTKWRASGQKINLEKSRIFLSPNVA